MNRGRSRPFAAALGVAAIALAGCSGGAPTAAPATPTPAPTVAPTPVVTATPVPVTPVPATPAPTAFAGADLCAAAEASGGEPLAAGAFRYAQSTPALTLTVPGGYSASCSGTMLTLFGPNNAAIVIVTGVGFINEPGNPTTVDPTVAAVLAAVIDVAGTATEPASGMIGSLPSTDLVITPGPNGFVVKGTDNFGWAFGEADAPNAAISIAEAQPGTVVLVLRHGADPVAVGTDILASLAWE